MKLGVVDSLTLLCLGLAVYFDQDVKKEARSEAQKATLQNSCTLASWIACSCHSWLKDIQE